MNKNKETMNSLNEKESVNMDKKYNLDAMVEAAIVEEINNPTKEAEEVAKEGFKLFSKAEVKNVLKAIKKYGTSTIYETMFYKLYSNKKIDVLDKLKSLKKEYSADATIWNKILSVMSIVFVKLAQVVFGITMFAVDTALILGVMTGRIAKGVIKEVLIASSGIKGAFKEDIVKAIMA